MHAAPTICLQPCPEGTRIHQKPTASSEGAQLWDKHHFTLSWFRKAGPTIILNIIRDASVPLLGTNLGGGILCTHSSAASQLAVGFHYIGPAPRNPYKTATFVTSFICYVVSLRSIHTFISFDIHIHIVRYTHSYRTM